MRVYGLGFRVQGSGFRGQESRVQGQGLGRKEQPSRAFIYIYIYIYIYINKYKYIYIFTRGRGSGTSPYNHLVDPSSLGSGFHIETLIIYKLSSRKFTTQNDLYT